MFLPRDEVLALGLAEVGRDVLIDSAAVIMGAGAIRIGDHTRIDAHSILSAGSGGIDLGRHVHVAAAAHLWGAAGIRMGNFAAVSARASVYSATDDYAEGYLSNPTVPDTLRKVTSAPVEIADMAVVGCGSVVMPGVRLGTGSAVGALSLVARSVPDYAFVAGNPLRGVGQRSRERLADLVRRHDVSGCC
ncbi:acyltransferase [Kineococcus glutinatus]|uniref:Acetyltransferase n=1 Tax=Kineococcus glutinatus TaxID=1070872 RepID=A0ABP9HAM3_9ACTN